MENLKSTLLVILMLVLIISFGVWSFSTIESGSTHVNNQIQKDLEDKNEDLTKEVEDLTDQISTLQAQIAKNTNDTNVVPVQEKTPTEPTKPVVLKYQSLIDELQKIYNDKVTMQKGSQGTRVGSIQKFFNIYNKTSYKIDNDFGPSMVTTVIKFQKDMGISADGGVGPGTVLKMIDWLKKQ